MFDITNVEERFVIVADTIKSIKDLPGIYRSYTKDLDLIPIISAMYISIVGEYTKKKDKAGELKDRCAACMQLLDTAEREMETDSIDQIICHLMSLHMHALYAKLTAGNTNNLFNSLEECRAKLVKYKGNKNVVVILTHMCNFLYDARGINRDAYKNSCCGGYCREVLFKFFGFILLLVGPTVFGLSFMIPMASETVFQAVTFCFGIIGLFIFSCGVGLMKCGIDEGRDASVAEYYENFFQEFPLTDSKPEPIQVESKIEDPMLFAN